MSHIEDLAEIYTKHIATPWQRTVAGSQRVIMIVYPKEYERKLRARIMAFENATRKAGHDWIQLDMTDAFARWMADDEYREAYFECPEDLRVKMDDEFCRHLAEIVRQTLHKPECGENSVLALTGLGSLFGFASVSQLVKHVEGDIRGRLLLFFPGQRESNNYRLLDARDGWNYMAVPISLNEEGSWL